MRRSASGIKKKWPERCSANAYPVYPVIDVANSGLSFQQLDGGQGIDRG